MCRSPNTMSKRNEFQLRRPAGQTEMFTWRDGIPASLATDEDDACAEDMTASATEDATSTDRESPPQREIRPNHALQQELF